MKQWLPILASIAALAFGAPAQAQYMFIDVDGDGDCDTNDIISTSTTSFDVWIDTDSNANGSTATCNSSSANMTINSYTIAMKYIGGSMTFVAWADSMGFTNALPGEEKGDNEAYVGWGSGAPLAAGRYKLGTYVITVASGSPRVAIQTYSLTTPPLAADPTSFGSACEGNDFDNTYKVNSDWFDVCGSDGITPVEASTWGKIKQRYR